MKNKVICFGINTIQQAEVIIKESIKNNILPIFFIKHYIVKGFGVEWVEALQSLLNSYKKSKYKLYIDTNRDYGMAINLIKAKVEYIRLKSDPVIIKKITQISKKNKVLLNPSFRIVDLSNIKNISRKISII